MKMLVWVSSLVGVTVFTLVSVAGEVRAQVATLKTETYQTEVRETQPQPSEQPKVVNQNRVVNQTPARVNQPVVNSEKEQLGSFRDLQNRVDTLENKVKDYQGDPRVANWLSWWSKVGLWTGILWMFLWVFVGTQWSRRKFWGFGWPWPWWFWIPILWFIPWLLIGWWWLEWWDWWVWVWWLWPWVFWVFWWLVIFKEATIWVWKGK